ncbi:MAG TPA: hypothetical protein VK453_08915 [Micromonosporaceae bacterium]|nr:hypothetical protein [Micromonosporaceae bacterium]
MNRNRLLGAAACGVLAATTVLSGPAMAGGNHSHGKGHSHSKGHGHSHAGKTTHVHAKLHELNNSGAYGRAKVAVRGTGLDVSYRAKGLLAGAPHAVHIHYGEEARHECPTLKDDTNRDGRLTTLEGVPAYGPIVVSLTTSGDTSPASGLAVDRFSTAPKGSIKYDRHIVTTRDTAADIRDGEAVLVIHGVDHNHNGSYDFGAGPSELDPALPAEATDTAACGVLR